MNSLNKNSRTAFETAIDKFEEECGFSDNLIYPVCLETTDGFDLSDIQEKDIRGPFRTFLINWGNMGRVLNNKRKAKWETDLAKTVRSNSKILSNFRKENLEQCNLHEYIDGIKECYQSIRKVVGPTCASKALHLICPTFFPMFDVAIRKGRKSSSKKSRGRGIGTSAQGYFKFMQKMQKLLQKHDITLSRLTGKYKKNKVKLLDEYLWWKENCKKYRSKEGQLGSRNEGQVLKY